MVNKVQDTSSPVERSKSSSLGSGWGVIVWASPISSSVVSPMADTTATTCLPESLVAPIRPATFKILLASATELPPYFCTINDKL